MFCFLYIISPGSREASYFTHFQPRQARPCSAGTGRKTSPACTRGWSPPPVAGSTPCCMSGGRHCSEGQQSPRMDRGETDGQKSRNLSFLKINPYPLDWLVRYKMPLAWNPKTRFASFPIHGYQSWTSNCFQLVFFHCYCLSVEENWFMNRFHTDFLECAWDLVP